MRRERTRPSFSFPIFGLVGSEGLNEGRMSRTSVSNEVGGQKLDSAHPSRDFVRLGIAPPFITLPVVGIARRSEQGMGLDEKSRLATTVDLAKRALLRPERE